MLNICCLLLASACSGLRVSVSPGPVVANGIPALRRIGRIRPCAGPAPAIAKPKTKIKHATYTGSPGNGGGKSSGAAATVTAKPKQITEDMPLWKVILLGDEEYVEEPVCDALVRVIPELANVMQAKERYHEAQQTGKSLLIVAPKEHAELYKEQLIREEPMVFADIEEE